MRFYRLLAQHILSRQAPPDLRAAVVLLPNYHAALPLAQALSSVSGALLLPQMLTLADWAQSLPLTVQPDSQRIVALYQALRERRWFPDADLWSLSRELLTLMDELTRHYVTLPETSEEFARQLAEAYQARSGQAMQFEARVLHELWYAMASSDDLDASRARQQRLAQLARQVDSPLYVLQTCDPDETETRFLQTCRERVEVTVFDLRAMVAAEPDCALLACALQQDGRSADLLSMAAGFKPDAALGGRLRLFGAHGMEQEAQAADVQIRRWLLEGRQSIAVVVQDRLVARRLRALLERARVAVQDETGWTFATLSVSTVLMRWLEAVQGDFYYQDVLDLLKSPFLFAENPAQRKQAAYQFEQLVRKHGVVAHLQDLIAVAGLHAPELVQPLVRLRQAARLLANNHLPLAGWLHALHESLEILGVVQGWQQDAAGQQLLQLLALWRDELQSDTSGKYSYAEWRRWLSQQLDLNTFRDVSVDSPVLFTHLPATRWRSFDAVLLLGCDAMHLPAPANTGQWFNDAVRATLGLPLSGRQQAQVRDDLLGLLAMNDNVLVTWQDRRDGEPNLLSPHFEMLRALHLLAFGDDLMDAELGEMLEKAQVRIDEDRGLRIKDRASVMPRPVVAPELIPLRISPSGYNSLVACPYQYFARHVLRLNELDEVREELDKRDYGTWVHEVLQRFHSEIPLLNDHPDAEQILRRISDEVFADALAHDYLAQAWLLRWQALIPAYLDWQRDNEEAGWRYQAAEQPIKLEVSENLLLSGRIDRIDVRVDDAAVAAVLDYKTQSAYALKNRLKEPGEDVQLACYAQAAGAGAAAFVSLEDDKVLAVAPTHDITALALDNLERLKTIFEQLHSGVPMPAHGAEKACAYCEMQGLCRRGEWEEKQERGLRTEDRVDAGEMHG